MQIPKFLSGFLFLMILVFNGFTQDPVKVFILCGQSNMEGQGNVPLSKGNDENGGMGTLEYTVNNDPDTWGHLLDNNGDWRERDDVWVYYKRGGDLELKGNLSPDYGASSTQIGPELQFGHVMGDYYDEQVLIIKTAWGGKSLAVDFRPPSSGDTGPYYNDVVSIIESVLNNIGSHFSNYNDRGYEIAGFGWHQGWNDGNPNDEYWLQYEENMVNFIKDMRVSLDVENMPFVIATSGHGGYEEEPYGGSWMYRLQDAVTPAQIAATDLDLHPEFEGNAVTHNTWDYWRNDSISPARSVHHWNLNAESYSLMGNGMATEMISLLEWGMTPVITGPGSTNTDISVFESGIQIQMTEQGNHSIVIHDIAGRELFARNGSGSKGYIFTHSVPGVLLLTISESDKITRQKLYMP